MTAQGPAPAGYFLVGPTASGKSDVAQWLAEHEGFDILSADSMLFYRGMDIGTAKPSKEDRERICYFGIDLGDPSSCFSVWEFRRYALNVLAESIAAGRRVIVVGGSGLYVKALTDGLDEMPGANPEQRARWDLLLATKGVAALKEELRSRSPALYDRLADKENPRRLIRALEQTAFASERPPSAWAEARDIQPMAGLLVSPGLLRLRIRSRVNAMWAGGLLDEVRCLLSKGAFSATAAQAIGYAEASSFLARQCTQDAAMEKTVTRTAQLAKRQRTWFRHQARVNWIEVRESSRVEDLAKAVMDHWRVYGPTAIAPG